MKKVLAISLLSLSNAYCMEIKKSTASALANYHEQPILNSAHLRIFMDCISNLFGTNSNTAQRRLAIDTYAMMSQNTKEVANEQLQAKGLTIVDLWDAELAALKENLLFNQFIELLEKDSTPRSAIIAAYEAFPPALKHDAAWIVHFIMGKPIDDFILQEKAFIEARAAFEKEAKEERAIIQSLTPQLDAVKEGIEIISKQVLALTAAHVASPQKAQLFTQLMQEENKEELQNMLTHLTADQLMPLIETAHKTDVSDIFEQLVIAYAARLKKDIIGKEKSASRSFDPIIEDIVKETIVTSQEKLTTLFYTLPYEEEQPAALPEDHQSPQLEPSDDIISSINEYGIIAKADDERVSVMDPWNALLCTINIDGDPVVSLTFIDNVTLKIGYQSRKKGILNLGVLTQKQELYTSLSARDLILLAGALEESNKVNQHMLLAQLPQGLQALAYELIHD